MGVLKTPKTPKPTPKKKGGKSPKGETPNGKAAVSPGGTPKSGKKKQKGQQNQSPKSAIKTDPIISKTPKKEPKTPKKEPATPAAKTPKPKKTPKAVKKEVVTPTSATKAQTEQTTPKSGKKRKLQTGNDDAAANGKSPKLEAFAGTASLADSPASAKKGKKKPAKKSAAGTKVQAKQAPSSEKLEQIKIRQKLNRKIKRMRSKLAKLGNTNPDATADLQKKIEGLLKLKDEKAPPAQTPKKEGVKKATKVKSKATAKPVAVTSPKAKKLGKSPAKGKKQ